MAVFQYKGVDSSGKNVKGVLDSDSPRMLRNQLRKQGIYLTQYTENSGGGGGAVRRGNTMAVAGSREVELSKAFLHSPKSCVDQREKCYPLIG